MTTHALRAAAALLATVAFAGAAHAAGPPPQNRIAAAADAVVAAGVPGVSVYARRGARAAVVTRGYADPATRRRMSASDRFRIGSITKTFVAAVTLQLVDEGKLTLDDTVEQHLPGLVPNGQAITIRQLLSHTSGLDDYFNNERIVAPYARSHTYDWPHRTLVRISAADKPLFAPGAAGRWSYSNTGYFLVGLTIEQVTGRTLGDELARRIFRPLGLTHTTLVSGPRLQGRHAHGYSTYFGKWQDVSVFSPSVLWAAGGIVSTPADVAVFYRKLYQGRVIPLPLVRAMQRPQVPLPGSHGREGYGLGLGRVVLPCGAAYGHGGDFPGYSTMSLATRDAKRQIVVAVNVDDETTMTGAQKEAVGRLTQVAYCG
jgi:D-alanyl-D-alanine carboxypeptidase